MRNRCEEDEKRKKEERHKRDLENAYLRKKADEFRENQRNTREFTQKVLSSQKVSDGRSIRSLTRINEEECRLFREREEEGNKNKAISVKNMEKNIEEDLRKFEEQRKMRAKSNHLRRVTE